MLSKLEDALQSKNMSRKISAQLLYEIGAMLNKRGIKARLLNCNILGGTLGVISLWQINKKRIIAKTHLSGDIYRSNLQKEFEILNELYADLIVLKQATIFCNSQKYVIIFMEYFHSCQDFEVDDVRNLISCCHLKLKNVKCKMPLYTMCDFAKYRKYAIKYFSSNHLIDRYMIDYLCDMEQDIQKILVKSKIISHGDLSNKNIYIGRSGQLVLLDWEDAIMSVENYDFLYWLTFFSQKKYLNRDCLEKYGLWNRESEVLLSTIILLKSYISAMTGAWLNNKCSFDDRILFIKEIFSR